MLLRLLRQTEWAHLLDFASPAFFDVLPAGPLAGQLRTLVGNLRDGPRFEDACAARQRSLDAHGLPIKMATRAMTTEGPSLDDGELVLSLYFHQLWTDSPTVLDLRPDRFRASGGAALWSPASLFIAWDPAFLAGLRGLYQGFYEGDDATFRRALASLNLAAAEEVFRAHFGADDQTAVRFEVQSFLATFHEAFLRCKADGTTLHPNFIALGTYLAALYVHLEALGGGPFDVRGAYRRSRQGFDQEVPSGLRHTVDSPLDPGPGQVAASFEVP